MEHLAKYLAETGLTQKQFADLVGATQPTVNRWLNGTKPLWAMASKIHAVTKGKVPVSAWADQSGTAAE